MVHGACVTIDNLEEPSHIAFFQTLGTNVLPTEEGGHIDIFVPLGSSGHYLLLIICVFFVYNIFGTFALMLGGVILRNKNTFRIVCETITYVFKIINKQ